MDTKTKLTTSNRWMRYGLGAKVRVSAPKYRDDCHTQPFVGEIVSVGMNYYEVMDDSLDVFSVSEDMLELISEKEMDSDLNKNTLIADSNFEEIIV